MTDQVNCKPDDFQEEDPTSPKFTPGPWVFNDLEMKIKGVGDIEGLTVIANVSPKMDYSRGMNTQCANAALIAAAPEMYKMLSEIFKWIYEHDEWWMDVPNKGGFDSDRIEKLLAKARGQNLENK